MFDVKSWWIKYSLRWTLEKLLRQLWGAIIVDASPVMITDDELGTPDSVGKIGMHVVRWCLVKRRSCIKIDLVSRYLSVEKTREERHHTTLIVPTQSFHACFQILRETNGVDQW